MDGPLKELAKLERLTDFSARTSKGNVQTVADSLDSLLHALYDVKQRIEAGTASEEVVIDLANGVEERKKEIEDRQKEVYGAIGRYGKALDKKFANVLPSSPPLFTSAGSVMALERTLVSHFLRTGEFELAETFLKECITEPSLNLKSKFVELHRILTALRHHNIHPALEWTSNNMSFLRSRSSHLEFNLHRSQYMRLLLASNPPEPLPALAYARACLGSLYHTRPLEINRLMSCVAYLPLSRLQTSPYADLASPAIHLDLEPLFTKEYCARQGLSRQVALRVVGDIGGGGALARIEKGRKVMRERKSEWSQTDELPIEIPLLPENRYHSIFTCPVSKEQSTEQNPPMMMSCGHVLTKESLHKLNKPSAPGRVKCPYCPVESQLKDALRVYF